MIRPDHQALLDQLQSEMVPHARLTRIVFDAYVAEGFSEEQAVRLTVSYLNRHALIGRAE